MAKDVVRNCPVVTVDAANAHVANVGDAGGSWLPDLRRDVTLNGRQCYRNVDWTIGA
jgi:hypothetical protein